jgi:uncharacterized Ntn-hydrolase superfamily protein
MPRWALHKKVGSCVILLMASVLAFSLPSTQIPLSTWSIVAADPSTGDVGVAGASCIAMYADGIAALVPGKGAGVAQALLDLENRNMVFDRLVAGDRAEEVVRKVTDPKYDNGVQDRQYGVVTIANRQVQLKTFTGKEAMTWAGSAEDVANAVTVQGNILAGPEVVADAMKAFKSEKTLPDRLMRALEAGSAAGGDVRCNNSRVKQTAAAAFILVARGGDRPYAAKGFGVTDQGKKDGPWLAISVSERLFGPNPVVELRKRYDAWKAQKPRRGVRFVAQSNAPPGLYIFRTLTPGSRPGLISIAPPGLYYWLLPFAAAMAFWIALTVFSAR